MRSSSATSASRGTLSRISVCLGEERRDHQRQRRVLGPRDRNDAVERPAADNPNPIHNPPPRGPAFRTRLSALKSKPEVMHPACGRAKRQAKRNAGPAGQAPPAVTSHPDCGGSREVPGSRPAPGCGLAPLAYWPARPGLRLAPLEVFAQSRRQPLAARRRFIRFAVWSWPTFRRPEVRAISAFTRVFDALWRASKGDGRGAAAVHPSRAASRPPQDDGQ